MWGFILNNMLFDFQEKISANPHSSTISLNYIHLIANSSGVMISMLASSVV